MKKTNGLLISFSCLVLASCGGTDNNKADTKDAAKRDIPVSNENARDRNIPASPAKENPVLKEEKKTAGPNEILAHIDKHVISAATFDQPDTNTEGIRNCLINIKNNLADASFQKAIVEVSILLADGKEYRTDYYTIVNLEPGGTKTIKIPNTTRGTNVISHVIKVKSNELTHGEYVLTGDHYVPKPE